MIHKLDPHPVLIKKSEGKEMKCCTLKGWLTVNGIGIYCQKEFFSCSSNPLVLSTKTRGSERSESHVSSSRIEPLGSTTKIRIKRTAKRL